MREIQAGERTDDVPEGVLADFGEYALAYREAWSEPAVRWLLSTVPTAMVFDDHETHAERRISDDWMREMTAKPWFDRHIRGGLVAYWVFQHLGNLGPGELGAESLFAKVCAIGDAADLLYEHLATEGSQIGHSRWSDSARASVEAVVDGSWAAPRLELAFTRALTGAGETRSQASAQGAEALPV